MVTNGISGEPLKKSLFATFHWTKEYVNCNLCGQDDCELVFAHDQHGLGLHTVMCLHCGLIYLNPRPTGRDYDQFYQHWYHRLYPSRAAFHAGQLGGRIAAETARRRCQSYASFLGDRTHLLEVGPGEGAFLIALRNLRPDSTLHGVDVSPLEVASCLRKGLDVFHGHTDRLPPECAGYTHVAAFHVLEHALDPVGMLRQIGSRLQAGGYLFLEVPNVLGSWSGLGMVHVAHPYQFAAVTLAQALETAGFEVVRLEMLEAPLFQSSLRAIARLTDGPVRSLAPAMPGVEEVRARFRHKLRHWRREVMTGRLKRAGSRLIGTHCTALLWEHTAGRQFRNALSSGNPPPAWQWEN